MTAFGLGPAPDEQAVEAARVIPRATYRVQLRPSFGFRAAAAIAPYLELLGVSHLYSSPVLQAAPGSEHGYDVVDPHRINAELGDDLDHRQLGRTLERHHLGQVIDIVPNHLAISGPENPWWWDVLENGPASRYAKYFDVDWDPPEAYLRDVVLLPILGDHYGRVLEAGELRLERRGGSFTVAYHDHRVPIAPRALGDLVMAAGRRVELDELMFVGGALGRLPSPTAVDLESVERRHRDKEVLRTQLARLTHEQPELARALDAEVDAANADPDTLDAILEAQNYRLAHWRAAGRDLGYRRFFDVTTLIGIRVEDPEVFADTHLVPMRWIRDGVIDGLRVDHPDGLRDPAAYFRRLREASPRGWIVAEKILEGHETLRADWPVDGTTGYGFLNLIGGLFVDASAEAAMTALYREFTGLDDDLAAVVRDSKQVVLRENLGSELNRLTGLLLEICEGHRRHRDHTRHACHEVLRELAVAFPRYRTYVRADAGMIDAGDEEILADVVDAAIDVNPPLDPDLFRFVGDILALRVRGPKESELVMRFQQLTGAVMAKGVEDTAFYRYHRLVSLNEVGGDPARFGVSPAAFHAANASRHAAWPDAMLTTSTHDTKRAEDVRARIHVLSEMPTEWAAAVWRWSGMLATYRTGELPDRNAEYLLYQTLVGAWPIDRERLEAYLTKAVREAKLHTSWGAPDEAYETALTSFAASAIADPAFIADLEAFLVPVVAAGRVGSIAQTLLKLTVPGVPDIYQGTDLWDLSLVDPDNRRPVDFERRARLLDGAGSATPESVLEEMEEGLPKLWTIARTLGLRRDRPELFDRRAAYRALEATGPRAGHVVALMRADDLVVVAPRLVHGLGGPAWGHADTWGSTHLALPAGTWTNLLGGGRADDGALTGGGDVPIAMLLDRFPVALLVRPTDNPA